MGRNCQVTSRTVRLHKLFFLFDLQTTTYLSCYFCSPFYSRTDNSIKNHFNSSIKRKIERYLAKKLNVTEDKIVSHEDGRYDFHGDIDGVLRAVRGKDFPSKRTKGGDENEDDEDDYLPSDQYPPTSSGRGREADGGGVPSFKKSRSSHPLHFRESNLKSSSDGSNYASFGYNASGKENINPFSTTNLPLRPMNFFHSPSYGNLRTQSQARTFTSKGADISKVVDGSLNPLDHEYDHLFNSPTDGAKLYQMIRSPDESCDINCTIQGMTPLSVLKQENDLSQPPFSHGNPREPSLQSNETMFDDLKNLLFATDKEMKKLDPACDEKDKVDSSTAGVTTRIDSGHAVCTSSLVTMGNFFTLDSYKKHDTYTKPTPSTSRSFRQVAVSPISQYPTCKRERRSTLFDSGTRPASFGDRMLNVTLDESTPQTSVCLGVFPLRALMASSPNIRHSLQISPSAQKDTNTKTRDTSQDWMNSYTLKSSDLSMF